MFGGYFLCGHSSPIHRTTVYNWKNTSSNARGQIVGSRFFFYFQGLIALACEEAVFRTRTTWFSFHTTAAWWDDNSDSNHLPTSQLLVRLESASTSRINTTFHLSFIRSSLLFLHLRTTPCRRTDTIACYVLAAEVWSPALALMRDDNGQSLIGLAAVWQLRSDNSGFNCSYWLIFFSTKLRPHISPISISSTSTGGMVYFCGIAPSALGQLFFLFF